jgi:hypothetical protein
MLRVVSAANSAASRIEAANPCLYVTTQILRGLDGVENAYPRRT